MSSLRRFLMQDTTVACAHLILSMGKEQLSHRNSTVTSRQVSSKPETDAAGHEGR